MVCYPKISKVWLLQDGFEVILFGVIDCFLLSIAFILYIYIYCFYRAVVALFIPLALLNCHRCVNFPYF